MHPPVPRGTAIQVFPSTGIHLTKPEMLENLKQKLATTRAACDQGGELITNIFGIAPAVTQNFADAVYAALTVRLPQQITFLENLPDPEPIELPPGFGGPMDPYRPSVEQLASAEMTVQNFEEQIGKIEEVAERDDLPPGVGALMGMGVPMLRQQLQQATEHRDYLRAAMERWEKANQ